MGLPIVGQVSFNVTLTLSEPKALQDYNLISLAFYLGGYPCHYLTSLTFTINFFRFSCLRISDSLYIPEVQIGQIPG